MRNGQVLFRALLFGQLALAGAPRAMGVRSVPAVAIDGTLATCCAGRGPDEQSLRAAGLGNAI